LQIARPGLAGRRINIRAGHFFPRPPGAAKEPKNRRRNPRREKYPPPPDRKNNFLPVGIFARREKISLVQNAREKIAK
jgi:hypothetical protein